MSKETIEKEEIHLNLEQLKELADELESYGKNGREQFLVNRKVIKVNEGGQWSVMKIEGLKNANMEAVYGYTYQNDIPYILWQEILQQVDNYLFKKEKRYKEQQKGINKEITPRPRYAN